MRAFGRVAIVLFVVSGLLGLPPSSAAAPRAPADELEEGEQLPPLKVEVDRSKVDLDNHRLEVKMSREARSVKIKVIGESTKVIANEEHDFKGAPAGKALVVSWSPSSSEKVARIEVYGYDAHGYYAGVAITPWSVSIPHKEVNFETNSAVIRDSEKPKLEDSHGKVTAAIEKHKELGSISLFIAGHTDTVGTPAHNLELSRKRARSIAAWFRKRGLTIPVFYEGFGESALAVKTEDEVDEARNRRADYILAIDPPRFKSSGSAPAWKKIP
jgi:outer membrane protein OmpA-like peptidoglycan-associated protein